MHKMSYLSSVQFFFVPWKVERSKST